MKSLCEVISLSSAVSEKISLGVANTDPLLAYSSDKARIRDLTIEEFKEEINMTVKKINQSISSNLGEVKILTLKKVEKIVSLTQKVENSEQA